MAKNTCKYCNNSIGFGLIIATHFVNYLKTDRWINRLLHLDMKYKWHGNCYITYLNTSKNKNDTIYFCKKNFDKFYENADSIREKYNKTLLF